MRHGEQVEVAVAVAASECGRRTGTAVWGVNRGGMELTQGPDIKDRDLGVALSFPMTDPRWQADLDCHDTKSGKN